MTKTACWRGAFSRITDDRKSWGHGRDASLESETIRKAQQGDSCAFERIYQLHSLRVYGLR
jgi:hypothetical protein